MRRLGLLDLDSRKGKAPGGYQTTFHEARLPFIFMNSVGVDGDVRTLLHEGGHAMHSWLSRDVAFAPYRSTPIEFAEVASMSMELLGDPFLDVFYNDPNEAKRSIRSHLENVILLLPWIANVDAFQHWLYLNPNHTREERKAYWLTLRKRFGGIEDWSGLEEAQAYSWHKQLHIFEIPFYYIEYGIAQLGALQVWRNATRNRAEGVAAYKNGLSKGSTLDLPGLFEAAGIQFDFSEATLKPLMQEVADALKKLDE
jgi:oligoendopeptidase F